MSERRGGLGRGLAALIPTGPVESAEDPAPETTAERSAPNGHSVPAVEKSGGTGERGWFAANATVSDHGGEVAGAVYREIPVEAIKANPKQPRQVFDEDALAELEHSIREFGLMQPIVVRVLGGDEFELVMGERRLRAAQQAGLEAIPAIVRSTADDAMLRDALLENIHRVQLNPLEEASAYQQLLDEFEVTHEELAARIGRSRPVITNTIRLLRLPLPVQRRVAANVLSAGHARALLSVDDAGRQEELAARIVAEGLSVRATEEAVTLSKSEPAPKQNQPERKPAHMPGVEGLAERLSDAFDTRIKVDVGRRKGRIVVEFGSADDLERIVTLMAPGHAQQIREAKQGIKNNSDMDSDEE